MNRVILILISIMIGISAFSANDDYNTRQARQYTQEAEYYQKKAESCRRESQYYLKQAENYQREAAYYTRKGDTDRAQDYTRRANRAMDSYKTQMRYAANADDKAADYLKRAARLLQN